MLNFFKNLFGTKAEETAVAAQEEVKVETKPAVSLPIADPADKPAKASKPKSSKPKSSKPKTAAKPKKAK